MGVSENEGTLFEGPFKGILCYLGYKRGTPIFGYLFMVFDPQPKTSVKCPMVNEWAGRASWFSTLNPKPKTSITCLKCES